MSVVFTYSGRSAVFVEGFPKDCKRSREGSINVWPRQMVTVTADEYDYILKKYESMKPFLSVNRRTEEEEKVVPSVKVKPVEKPEKEVESTSVAKPEKEVETEVKAKVKKSGKRKY